MISPTFPSAKRRILGGSGGANGRRQLEHAVLLGLEGGRKEGWGRRGLARAQDIAPVALVNVARQACPRRQPAWCAQWSAASVAALSRHPDWRNRG